MSEQEKIKIDNFKTIEEWDNWVKLNAPSYSSKKKRGVEEELADYLHKKRFELIKKNGLTLDYFLK